MEPPVSSPIDKCNTDGNNTKESELTILLKNYVYDEIINRIKFNRDKNALDILASAKQALKENVHTLKWALIALKPFYLMAVIAIMSQKPESI